MGSVPAFLLRKLYVKGSLKNTAAGFELTIQNTLASGTIIGLAPLQVDGIQYPLVKTTAILPDGTQASAVDVSAESGVRFSVGDRVTIRVEGKPLPAGQHKLAISPKTKEVGILDIFAEDMIT